MSMRLEYILGDYWYVADWFA